MNPLFTTGDFSAVSQSYINGMKAEVDSWETDYILSLSEDELTKYLNEKYSIEELELFPDKIEIIDESESIEKVNDYDRIVSVRKTVITVAVPFSGDQGLFGLRASTYDTAPPYGLVQNNEVHFRFSISNAGSEEINRNIHKTVLSLQKYLGWMNQDINSFNTRLEKEAALYVTRKKEKCLADRETIKNLNIPIRRRQDAPETYRVPMARKRVNVERPQSSGKPQEPEPELELETYQNILDVIRNMVYVMERSPRAFENMGEEELRDHFLVQLNGQFEGQATGETFNFSGKTDILVRADERNIFIAECKFWTGSSNFSKTIDQLLSYLSWRDSKAAILIFNRNKNLSSVLEKIPQEIKKHPNYKGDLKLARETEFTCKFTSTNDKERELLLTVMVFDVPSSEK